MHIGMYIRTYLDLYVTLSPATSEFTTTTPALRSGRLDSFFQSEENVLERFHDALAYSRRCNSRSWDRILEPILRLNNLQLQRQRCSRREAGS
jgi:hypothetical protein